MENQGLGIFPPVPDIEAGKSNVAGFESCLFPQIECNSIVTDKVFLHINLWFFFMIFCIYTLVLELI